MALYYLEKLTKYFFSLSKNILKKSMRCSNCYKRIIEGDEVQQGNSGFFRTSWDG